MDRWAAAGHGGHRLCGSVLGTGRRRCKIATTEKRAPSRGKRNDKGESKWGRTYGERKISHLVGRAEGHWESQGFRTGTTSEIMDSETYTLARATRKFAMGNERGRDQTIPRTRRRWRPSRYATTRGPRLKRHNGSNRDGRHTRCGGEHCHDQMDAGPSGSRRQRKGGPLGETGSKD